MLTGILYQVISMCSFGTGNVLWKVPQKSFSVAKIIVLRTSVSVLLFGSIALYQCDYVGTPYDWLLATLISAVSFLGLLFYNKSIKESTVSHSITITSTSALFGVITSIIFYNESITWSLLLALFMIVSGLFLIEGKKPVINWSKGTLYAILASFFWGTTFALFKIPVNKIGDVNFSLVLESTVLICSFLIFMSQRKIPNTHKPTVRTYMFILILGVLGFIGVIFYNKAVQIVDVSKLSVLGAFTPVITICIAHLWLKEKFKLWQYVGMILTILAVFLLAF